MKLKMLKDRAVCINGIHSKELKAGVTYSISELDSFVFKSLVDNGSAKQVVAKKPAKKKAAPKKEPEKVVKKKMPINSELEEVKKQPANDGIIPIILVEDEKKSKNSKSLKIDIQDKMVKLQDADSK